MQTELIDFGPLKQVTVSDCSVSLNSEQKAINSPDPVPQVLSLPWLSPGLPRRCHYISMVCGNWTEPSILPQLVGALL